MLAPEGRARWLRLFKRPAAREVGVESLDRPFLSFSWFPATLPLATSSSNDDCLLRPSLQDISDLSQYFGVQPNRKWAALFFCESRLRGFCHGCGCSQPTGRSPPPLDKSRRWLPLANSL
ncbi:hypothetical protein BO71DRAFT_396708 [Aspergillus ellipticus CBS 707.79]|uniref:Uncharacterized protein n=1 Tax=Aspergillus ellipticus CBS 707.79 TaxID=1448320 RepID=A0A319DH55_9EURO|nr:hypothetical protein BO71DRAFT_396708 [Aspergillus ellipticus CBS 707.79]